MDLPVLRATSSVKMVNVSENHGCVMDHTMTVVTNRMKAIVVSVQGQQLHFLQDVQSIDKPRPPSKDP